MAAGHSVNPDRWQDAFDELMGRLAPQFSRAEPRRRARAFVLVLLAELPRVGVYLVCAAGGGHAFLDRALYLPRSWAEDPARLAAAGVPDDVGFATKPALARAMLARALDAGIPARWVAGDEVYGADPGLRADLHARGVGYVLAVASNHRVRTAAGPLPVAGPGRAAPQPSLGSGTAPWREPKGSGSMTGRGSRCSTPTPPAAPGR